jgi:CheY-like chemotaxis protein
MEFQIKSTKTPQVLVVDDNKANLNIARGLLSPYDLSVDTAASGQEAIEKVKRKNYDMIFMDHLMPEMDGIEATKSIRAWEKEREQGLSATQTRVPIVAITANDMQGIREFYLENGFNDYLAKPINPKALDEVVGKYFKEQRAKINEQRTEGNEQLALRNVNIAVELESRRLDKLNHFRAAFDSGRTIEQEYFMKLTALIESMDIGDDTDLQEQAILLTEAGRREDPQTIRKILPAFCDAMAAVQQTATQQQQRDATGAENPLPAILSRLKKALLAGETKIAETILSELRPVKLSSSERELYFRLYDFLVKNKTEKAADAINFWERLQDAQNQD